MLSEIQDLRAEAMNLMEHIRLGKEEMKKLYGGNIGGFRPWFIVPPDLSDEEIYFFHPVDDYKKE